jgi:hypothetical protein
VSAAPTARERIFSAALANQWQQEWDPGERTVTFRRGEHRVVINFTEQKLHPATAPPLAQRVVSGYRTVSYRNSPGLGTLAYSGRDKVGQILDTLRGQDSGL